MRVKICGLTRAEDARYAEECGAFALGFIFYPGSRRYVTPAIVAEILPHLSGAAMTVGVFVNNIQGAMDIADTLSLGAVQLHGEETPEECLRIRRAFPGKIIKAFHPKEIRDLAAIEDYKGAVDYALIDAAVPGARGGTGIPADWELAAIAAQSGLPLFLSGGLGPNNAATAISKVKPCAIDLASGVEDSPGIKNHAKITALFAAVKETTP